MKTNRKMIFRRKLVAVAVASCFTITPVFANPMGATVVNGQVGFAAQGSTLTVTNSPNSIINWQQFSINTGEVTRFVQQSVQSAVLNRVVGQEPSQLLGSLLSNGRVYLINPNGILFGQGAVIDVGGLVASTLKLSDGDFLAGRLNFTGGAGAGGINNQGSITTPAGGNVYLIAPDITNSGVITSPQGEILLAAGHTVNLMDTTTPNVQVTVGAPDTQAVNLGSLIARSGKAGIYGALIDQQGLVDANTAVVGANGKITLRASKDITLEPGSVITASGMAGGVKDGGEIRIVADGKLAMRQGSEIHVDGGVDGGNGGFLELSGKTGMVLRGMYSGRAHKAGYRNGTLLLDPMNIDISSAGSALSSAGAGSYNATASSGTSGSTWLVNPNMIGLTGWSAVNLNAGRDIAVSSPIKNSDVASGVALRLNAGRDITVSKQIGATSLASISGSTARFNHDLTLSAGNNVNINASIYMGSNTLIARAGASVDQLNGISPYACSPCSRSVFITPAAPNSPVTVDVQGGIELYAPSGAVNIFGGYAGNNQDTSVKVHGGTVKVDAGSVAIWGGTANASASEGATITADASAELSAGTTLDITASGGLAVLGGHAAASASSGATASATANAKLLGGTVNITTGSGVGVLGGYAGASASDGAHASATANAMLHGGTVNITTSGSGVGVVGGHAVASASGYWSRASAAASANADLSATGSLTIDSAGGLTVAGGGYINSSSRALAQAWDGASAAASANAVVKAASMDITLNGTLGVYGGTSASAHAHGSSVNLATTHADAELSTTGMLTINNASGLFVHGGYSTKALASGSGANGAGASTKATVKAGSMDVTLSSGMRVVGGSYGSARAAGSGVNTAAVTSNATIAATGGDITVSSGSGDVRGAYSDHAFASGSGTLIATVNGNAELSASGALNITSTGSTLTVAAGYNTKASASGGGSAGAAANALLHAATVDVTAGSGWVNVLGGSSAEARVHGSGVATAMAKAEFSATGGLTITTAGGLAVAGGRNARASVSSGDSTVATTNANARLAAGGNMTLNVSSNVGVAGGNFAYANAYGYGGGNNTAIAHADGGIFATGLLTLNAASLMIDGGEGAAYAFYSGVNSAQTTSNATMQAGSLDITLTGQLAMSGASFGRASADNLNTATAQGNALITVGGNTSLRIGGDMSLYGGSASASGPGATAQAVALIESGTTLSGTMLVDVGGNMFITGGNYNGPGALAFAGIVNTGPLNMTIGGATGLVFTGGDGGATYNGWTVPNTGLSPDPTSAISITYTGGGMLQPIDPYYSYLDSAFIMTRMSGLPGVVLAAVDFGANTANGSTNFDAFFEPIRFGEEHEDKKNEKPVCR